MKQVEPLRSACALRKLYPPSRKAALATTIALCLAAYTHAQCVNATSHSLTQIPLLSTVTNPGNAYDLNDGDQTTAATLTVNGVGVATLNVTFDQNANKGDSIIVMFGVPTANILDWGSLGSTTFTPFSGTNAAGTASATYTASSLAFIISVGTNSLARIAVPVTDAAGALSLRIQFTGIGIVLNKQNFVYDVAVKPGPVTAGAGAAICNGTATTLTASKHALAAQAVDLLWYDSDGTTLLQSNTNQNGAPYVSSYTTPVLTATKTFYVKERWNGCTLLSDPVPVVATVRAPIVPNIEVNCGTPITLSTTTTGATLPVTYAWSATGGGNIVAGQQASATPAISGIGNYTVTLTDANSCTGTVSRPVTAGDCIALDITLSSFDASPDGADALLQWTAAAAEADVWFGLERSTDGRYWTPVHTMPATADKLFYAFTDKNAAATGGNSLLYRLKVIDPDGTFSLSGTREVHFSVNEDFAFFPNPLTGSELLFHSRRPELIGTIAILNMAGQKIAVTDNATRIDTKALTPGLYILQVDYKDGSRRSYKVIRQ